MKPNKKDPYEEHGCDFKNEDECSEELDESGADIYSDERNVGEIE